MTKIVFVCYGNICRSPMAEYIMKDMTKGEGFIIESRATSSEELGNPVHRGTAKILERMGIDYSDKRAVRLQRSDYTKYDYIVGMDEMNRRDMLRLFGGDPDGKISLLLDYTNEKRDVADPYWTRNFEQTFIDVVNGVNGLYKHIKGE